MPLTPDQTQDYFGVPIFDESLIEHWVQFGTSSATRTILCNWQDRIALINNIMGIGGINSASQYIVTTNAPYPDGPSLFISSIDVTGVVANTGFDAAPASLSVDPNGIVAYPLARCVLKYTTLPYDPNNLNVTSMDYSVEEVTVPGNTFNWTNAAYRKLPISQNIYPSLRVPTLTITIQQFLQPFLPTAVVAPILGNVNQASVFGFDQPGQTCLSGYKTNRRIPISGMVNYDCTMNLQVLLLPGGAGWNHKLCPAAKAMGGALWQPVADGNGDGDPPFAIVDFTPLGINNPTGLVP